MATQYVDIPSGGSGSGVSSLNGLTGALTLVAGANITITPGAGTLTISSTGGGGITSINADTTAAQTLTTSTAGTDFAITNPGSGSHVFNLPTASATNRGALSSANWSTFNAKFDLPSLTAGSVLFSDGTTIAQDNTNFFWDDAINRLRLGNPASHGGNLLTIDSNLDATDPATDFNADHNSQVSLHLTANTSTALYNHNASNKVLIDAGVTAGGGNINYGSIIDRQDAADLGTSGALVNFYGYISQSNGAKTTPLFASFLTGGSSVSDGVVSSMYDFYAMSSSLTAATVTSRYGIVIEADSGYTKTNFLSGDTRLGGTTLADIDQFKWDSANKQLQIGDQTQLTGDNQGSIRAVRQVTDPANAISTVFTGQLDANYTINTPGGAIGQELFTKIKIDSGITVGAGGGIFAPLGRADAADAGILDIGIGVASSLTQGGNASKLTNTYMGFFTGFHSIDSNPNQITNMYDFRAGLSSIAAGAVTNRYGIMIEPDSGYTKQNWLSGTTQIGGTSFSTPVKSLEVDGDASATGDIAAATMTPANGATGTFTTVDLKTVTVTNGIITSII